MLDVHDLEQNFKELLVTKRRSSLAKGRSSTLRDHASPSRTRTKLKNYRAIRSLTIQIPVSPCDLICGKRTAGLEILDAVCCDNVLKEKVFDHFLFRDVWRCAQLFSDGFKRANVDFPEHSELEKEKMMFLRMDVCHPRHLTNTLSLRSRQVCESRVSDILEADEASQVPNAKIHILDDAMVSREAINLCLCFILICHLCAAVGCGCSFARHCP